MSVLHQALRVGLAALLLGLPAQAQDLEIHILNVDQGSAAFVRGPNGTRVLVDAGNSGVGATITSYLASIGVTDLDYSVLSSFDADHCGGMDDVFNAGWVPNIAAWDRGDVAPKGTVQESQYKSAAGALRHLPVVGEQIALGSGATIQCVAVNGEHATGSVAVAGTIQEENSRSLAVVVSYGDFQFFLGGDLTSGGNGTADVEGPVSANVGQVEAMTSGHHGSNTSSTGPVIGNFDPSFVIHSAGVNAGYGHPTKSTCNAFNTLTNCRVQWCTTAGNQLSGGSNNPTAAGAFTAANGNTKVRSNGTHFWVTRVTGGQELQFACFGQAGATPAAGDLVVSEVMVDPVGASDVFGDWLEIVNISTGTIDLKGCRVRSGGVTFIVDSHLQLRAGEYAVIGVDGVPSRNGNVFCDLCAPYEQVSLANGTSYVELLTPASQLIDRVDWGGAGVVVNAGITDERKSLFGSSAPANFANAVAAWSGGDLGTPGVVNDADVPPVVGTTLVVLQPTQVGGQVQWELDSPAHPGFVYSLNISNGVFPGFDYLGTHIPLNFDQTFINFFGYPGFLANLDFGGHRTVIVPIANNPTLAGINVFTAFLVIEFDVPTFSWQIRAVSNVVQITIQP